MSKDKTLETILERLEDLSTRVNSLAMDVDSLKDARETRAFFRLNSRRNVPERPGQPGKRIHMDVYFAFAGDKEVYRARSLLEFAALYDLEYQFGAIGGWPVVQNRNKKERLHLEAGAVRAQLRRNGIELAMFAYYLSSDYERVPYVELFDPHEPEIDAWIEENSCIISNHMKAQPEPPEKDDRDPKKRLLVCKDCKFRTETKGRIIQCKRHKAIVPRYYTKLDVRNYLESARKVCDYPRCFTEKAGENTCTNMVSGSARTQGQVLD